MILTNISYLNLQMLDIHDKFNDFVWSVHAFLCILVFIGMVGKFF